MRTPEQIMEIKFKKAFSGYDTKSVDDFLDELTKDYSLLYKENTELKEKIHIHKKAQTEGAVCIYCGQSLVEE